MRTKLFLKDLDTNVKLWLLKGWAWCDDNDDDTFEIFQEFFQTMCLPWEKVVRGANGQDHLQHYNFFLNLFL